MKYRLWLAACAIALVPMQGAAQQLMAVSGKAAPGAFRHLDVALTVGSTGLGLEASSPISSVVSIRTGASFMPGWHYNMKYDIQVGDTKESHYDKQGNRVETKFDKMAKYLEQMTGHRVDDRVKMICEPTYYNAKLLVDVYPFHDKHWHFTTGFFVGNSRIGKAYNATEDMQSLVAVSIYNNMYDKYKAGEPLVNYKGSNYYIDPELGDKMLSYGRMAIHLGNFTDQYLEQHHTKNADGFYQDAEGKELKHLTDKNGNVYYPYMMEPDNDCMMRAEAKANAFKPYLGFGYGGHLFKQNNPWAERWNVSFDCGTMFWGGTPQILTYDGIDLAKDVVNINGRPGKRVKQIKAFKVFPVIDLKIAYRIF